MYIDGMKALELNEKILRQEQNKKRAAAFKQTGKRAAVGLIVVSALALVTYGVLNARQRFKNY